MSRILIEYHICLKKHGVWFEVDTKLNIYTKLRKLGAAVVLLSSNDAKGNSISKKFFSFI